MDRRERTNEVRRLSGRRARIKGCIVRPLSDNMRNKHYSRKSIRMSDEVWDGLQRLRGDQSWNLFLKSFMQIEIELPLSDEVYAKLKKLKKELGGSWDDVFKELMRRPNDKF